MSEYIVRMPPSMPYEIRAELNAWYVESEPIVRCKDCKHYEKHGSFAMCMLPDGDGDYACWIVAPDGFCAWGERDVEWVTCKCGEDIERHDRIQTCPSCGRRVMA